ncbi:RNase H-like domain-containing protein, partial [Cobetia crustatorum]
MEWTPECEQAFQQLKQYLGSPPLLSKPEEGEPLFLYLAVSASAVSSALIREVGGRQLPVYYVSKALVSAETRYSLLEQLALSLVTSARRLRPYFQAHPVIVVTDSPLRQVLQKPEVSGRITKWAIELGEFDIQFRPRTAIKGQAVADFIAKFTKPDTGEAGNEDMVGPTPLNDQKAAPDPGWVLYVDGSSNVRGAGAGV